MSFDYDIVLSKKGDLALFIHKQGEAPLNPKISYDCDLNILSFQRRPDEKQDIELVMDKAIQAVQNNNIIAIFEVSHDNPEDSISYMLKIEKSAA